MIIVVLYDASYQNLASFSLEFLSKYVFTFFRNISYAYTQEDKEVGR